LETQYQTKLKNFKNWRHYTISSYWKCYINKPK